MELANNRLIHETYKQGQPPFLKHAGFCGNTARIQIRVDKGVKNPPAL